MKKAIPTFLVLAITLISFRKSDDTKPGINYDMKIKPFIEKNCGNCHSTIGRHPYFPYGGDLSTYDSLIKRVQDGKLYDHVYVKKDMPPSMGWSLAPRLDSTDLLMLDSWIRQVSSKE